MLSINGKDMFGIKNTFASTHLKLFSPKELIKVIEKVDGEDYERTLYRTTVKKARLRLEILGCSEKKLKEYFERGLRYKQRYYLEEDYFASELDYYKQLNYEEYSNALRLFLESDNINIYDENVMKKNIHLSSNIFSKQIILNLRNGMYFNPFFNDEIYENEEYLIDQMLDIYMCIINSDKNAIVEYDLTNVIDGGWINESETQNFFNDFMDTTIIVTEGKTDIKILSKSLEILFPEFQHLYTFFDFYTYKADGGTTYLAKLVKSFSASKINNRIIALFDNDVAAEVEIDKLSKIPISNNIMVMKLPFLEFCESYPTLGPTGKENLDINGLAVSIELFFGDDIIKMDSEYYPIQWTNYVQSIEKYQGSITNKSNLITQMEKKLLYPDLKNQDWNALILLWKSIFESKF